MRLYNFNSFNLEFCQAAICDVHFHCLVMAVDIEDLLPTVEKQLLNDIMDHDVQRGEYIMSLML